ncbi:MAG: hypothetical protein ACJ8C4_06995 [Gemmataceae bacterium]
MISRDPSEVPDLSDELEQAARSTNKGIAHIICEPKDAKVNEPGGVSFFALMDFLPRIGETILTQNKRRCRVVDVFHTVNPARKAGNQIGFSMIPIVIAELIDEE